MERKQQIRKQHLSERSALSESVAEQLSAQISAYSREYLTGQNNLREHGVFGYYPLKKEVSLLHLYAWLLAEHVPLAFPRVCGDTMEFYQITSMEDFTEGAFHIMEPQMKCPVADFPKAYCFVPGSVFDLTGNRYGYGKGYYDRYFAQHEKLIRIGTAYEMQVEEWIEAEETDVKMQVLVTETGIRTFDR